MNPIIAQAIPPLSVIPFGLLYVFGVPLGAVSALLVNIAVRSLPRRQFLLLAWFSLAVPLAGLISMEIIETDNRAFFHRTLWDDAKANAGYWAMTFFAVALGAVALYRRSRHALRASR